MCVREFDLKVPYGVVETDGHNLKELVEKPMHKFFVNAGIYVLSPEALDSIPDGEFFDMTSLFQTLLKKGESTTTFPVHEYWRDIGQLPDFQSAVLDYPVIFS
jgi:NDP-sugar pyrophosphorylase family protein